MSSATLSTSIVRALRQSRYLIVICSPRTPGSRWVAQEIETFRELGGAEQILVLLIEGEPEESFPVPLREGSEPLAADVRAADWPGILRRLDEEILRLLAPLFGCGYDDLRRRHQRRTLQFWYIVGGAVFALLAGLTVLIPWLFPGGR